MRSRGREIEREGGSKRMREGERERGVRRDGEIETQVEN